MPTIEWTEFSWEAFATILTGLAAVVAAVIVGLRQTAITSKQTAILGKQAEVQERLERLEELKLREALFDDRFEVYEDTRNYLRFIVQHAAIPAEPRRPGPPIPPDEWKLRRRFVESMDRARFLFRPEVYQSLNVIWTDAMQINYWQKQVDRTEGEARSKAVDTECDLLTAMGNRFMDLSTIFGHELTLSQHGAVHGDLPQPAAGA